jgi:myo-inositol-1(or 4)-monophosphatase
MERKDFANFAIQLAKLGGDALKKYWGNLSLIEEKTNPADLVTEADKESERVIFAEIQRRFPSHALLGEESGATGNQEGEYLWVVDPLDGTTNYAHQYPYFSVSIALVHRGQPVVGVVFHPLYNELFVGIKGEGAALNGQPVKVTQTDSLTRSLLATGFPYNRRETPKNNYAEFCRITSLTQGVRRQGSAALDLAYVACGRLEGFWELGLKPWDTAAGVLLVEEAGGTVSDYSGKPFDIFTDSVLATNGSIHEQMVRELKNS